MSTILENLNPQQKQAVTLPAQSALIIAGAGSGKTRVLTSRIAWLLEQNIAQPFNILAVTFTNKAAKEMALRVQSMLPIVKSQLWVGTFHSLSHRVLRLHSKEANLPPNFQILDNNDQKALIKRLHKTQQLDEEKYPINLLMSYINNAKEQGLRSHEVDVQNVYYETLATFYREYEAVCQNEGWVDFAELLLRSVELLSRNQALLEHYQNRLQHILIDEFQDTNDLQYRWLRLLSKGEKNASVFAVGDDDQSIYAFRGAKVSHMRAFEREFNVQHIIRLEHNYRSLGNILDCANALIKNNPNRLGKNLFTESPQGNPLTITESANAEEEAKWLGQNIEKLALSSNATMPLNEIAVLYRTNAQSRLLEHTLIKLGIPYKIYGGLRFYDRAEIKNILAYLQVILNPNNDTSLLRIINFPPRGIGNKTLEKLQDVAGSSDLSIFQSLEYSEKSNVRAFSILLKEMQDAALDYAFNDWIHFVIEKTQLIEHYKEEKESTERLENLYQLAIAIRQFCEEYSAEHGDHNLSNFDLLGEFLATAALESAERKSDNQDECVQLMTVHSAKGLEFDAVFLVGLEEGLFPHNNSLQEDADLEEERRLMYVAITRARKELFLSYANKRSVYGSTHYCLPSRFLEELPAENVEWICSDASHKTSFKMGDSVTHPLYGEGMVLELLPYNQVYVQFASGSKKILDLASTQLTLQ